MSLQAEDVLDFYELEAELRKIDAMASPAEAHGILCGQLSAGQQDNQMAWLREYLPNLGAKGEPWENTQVWFLQLHKFTLAELSADQFNFMPLLPDDEDPLSTRLNSLAEWCSGFLAGFSSAGSRKPEEFTEDALTALRDIQQISQVDTEIDEEEDGEAAYFEVLEYVRMAALMIFTEFGMDREYRVPPGTTLH